MVKISQVDLSTFSLLVRYLYTDQLDEELSVSSILSVFVAADRFGIDRLKRMAEVIILSFISIENACSIFRAADMHAAVTLRRKSVDFIQKNYDLVVKGIEFEELARSNIELTLELIRLGRS